MARFEPAKRRVLSKCTVDISQLINFRKFKVLLNPSCIEVFYRKRDFTNKSTLR